MPHWIRLVTFTDSGIDYLRRSPSSFLAEMNHVITENGGKLLAAFATLGPFDVLSIVEAPSEETMEVIDEAVSGQGYYTSENYPAIPAKDYLATVAKSPIFLSSWMHGREVAQAKAVADAEKKAKLRASGKKGNRPGGPGNRRPKR